MIVPEGVVLTEVHNFEFAYIKFHFPFVGPVVYSSCLSRSFCGEGVLIDRTVLPKRSEN